MAAGLNLVSANVIEDGAVLAAKHQVHIRGNVMRVQDRRGRDVLVVDGVESVVADPDVPRRWQIVAGDRRLLVDKLRRSG